MGKRRDKTKFIVVILKTCKRNSGEWRRRMRQSTSGQHGPQTGARARWTRKSTEGRACRNNFHRTSATPILHGLWGQNQSRPPGPQEASHANITNSPEREERPLRLAWGQRQQTKCKSYEFTSRASVESVLGGLGAEKDKKILFFIRAAPSIRSS